MKVYAKKKKYLVEEWTDLLKKELFMVYEWKRKKNVIPEWFCGWMYWPFKGNKVIIL